MFAAFVVLAALFAFSQPKHYESTATIVFTPDPKQGQQFLPSDNLSALLSTYAELAKSDRIRAQAATILGHRVPGHVGTSTGGGSAVLEINGKDTNPVGAAETARSVSQAVLNDIQGNGILVGSIVNPPAVPSSPLQPRPPLIISIAGFLGLIAGMLLALARESFRRHVETPAELAKLSDIPVIGRLPRNRALGREQSSLVWGSRRMEDLQEAYRALRTNVELLAEGRSPIVQITSPDEGQGKSTVVANLGIALGQLGIETLIVDADLRRPRQHEIFDLDNRNGLSTALVRQDSELVPQPTDFRSVSVLTSGPIPADPAEMLHVRLRSVMREFRERGLFVIIDSPPVLPVTDSRVIAPMTDGVLLVVAARMTRISAMTSSIEKLRFAGAHLLGLVMNFTGRDEELTGSYGYAGYEHPQQQHAHQEF